MKWLLIVLFIIIAVAMIFFFWRGPELLEVEIKALPGTEVFVTGVGGEKEQLNAISTDNGSITVGVPIYATDIILKYDNQETVFPRYTWEEGVTLPVSIGIQAVPWAEVFIKSAETNEETSYGHTPLTVAVPIDAKVILRFNNQETVFPYEMWKNGEDGKEISHDFLNP